MRHLEIGNLQNDRKHFHKINKGENRNIQGKFRLQRHRHHETAECKRTRISHKNLCGIRIEYEKSQNSAEYRAGQGSEGVSSQKKLIGKKEKKSVKFAPVSVAVMIKREIGKNQIPKSSFCPFTKGSRKAVL